MLIFPLESWRAANHCLDSSSKDSVILWQTKASDPCHLVSLATHRCLLPSCILISSVCFIISCKLSHPAWACSPQVWMRTSAAEAYVFLHQFFSNSVSYLKFIFPFSRPAIFSPSLPFIIFSSQCSFNFSQSPLPTTSISPDFSALLVL